MFARFKDTEILLGFPLFGVLSNDFLATCSRDKEGKEESVLMVHDPSRWQEDQVYSNWTERCVRSLLVLSNDQVAIGFENGSIKIFDLNGGETRAIDRAHESGVTSLFQLSNGNLVSSGWDKGKVTIKMWNLADLSLLQTIQTDHENIIQSIDVSKDGDISGNWQRWTTASKFGLFFIETADFPDIIFLAPF